MRRAHDFYETPKYFVDVLFNAVPTIRLGHNIEPCVGDGAIARFLPNCDTNDIDHQRTANWHFDAACDWPHSEFYDWGVSNPPFKFALPILQQMVAHCQYVAAVLRISFFEPTKDRVEWLSKNPPSGLIYLPRYSFTNNGKSDMTTVCWALWNYPMTPAIQIAQRFPVESEPAEPSLYEEFEGVRLTAD